MSKKAILGIVVGSIVVVLLAIVAFYWYEGDNFVDTEDARVSANLVTISPEINGKIVEWDVKEGDMIKAGDVLGRQDLSAVLSSGVINTAAMGTISSIAAEKASIKSPISGQVIKSSAVIGQMAVPGSNLAVVADTDQLYVGANIDENKIGRVRIGQTVEMDVDAFPGVPFRGRVETIGRATMSTFSLLPSSNSGGNYTKVTQIVPIKVHLLDTYQKPLLVGMNTSIRILLKFWKGLEMNNVLMTGAALAALLLASCSGHTNDALELKAAPPTLSTLKRTVELSGVLTPESTAQVYGKLQGQASRIVVDVGSRVRAGDILLEIDSHELNAQLALAEASVATVKQQAAQALNGIDTAKTNYDQAKRAIDRINSLQDQSALSKAQIDDANSKVELTQRAWDSAKLQYKTLSESGLAQAQAQADVVRSQIANSILRSPITGVVTNRNINPGELTSTSVAMFSIAAIDSLKLQGTVSQDVVSLLSQGRQVSVVVDGLPGAPLDGRVTQIGPVAASSGQYFPVVVNIEKPGKALAGMTARVSLDVIAPEAPVLPISAVKTDQGRAWVFLVEDGKARQIEVGLGLSDGRSVQVVRGLKADQVVALTNVSLLTDAAPVKVLP